MTYYETLLKKYGYCDGLVGINSDGESVIVTIDHYEANLTTLQTNGWLRINIYHKDGTEEEMYKK